MKQRKGAVSGISWSRAGKSGTSAAARQRLSLTGVLELTEDPAPVEVVEWMAKQVFTIVVRWKSTNLDIHSVLQQMYPRNSYELQHQILDGVAELIRALPRH